MASNGQQSFISTTVLPDELSYLTTAFLPSQSSESRSKTYLILSAFCQGVRQSQPNQQGEAGTEALVKIFAPLIMPRLEETNENDLLVGISLLTALFQVDWQSAVSIFQQDMVQELIMDSVELAPSAQLSLQVAHLLSQACGYKPTRAALSSQATRWLESKSSTTLDPALRAAAAIALIKLTKGSSADNAADPSAAPVLDEKQVADMGLASVMKRLVLDGGDQSSLADAVEGLVYLSTDPMIKEELSSDPQLLKGLFALVSKRRAPTNDFAPTVLYGILVIITNICAYRPQLTDEQKQMERLKSLAKSSTKSLDTSSPLNDDLRVKERIKKLLSAGVLGVFASVTPSTDTPGIRINAGQALLHIVTDKDNRGLVLQHGGAKLLNLLIQKALSESKENADLDPVHLQPIQALAKLAITSSPVAVFGPNVGTMYDAIRPFSLMLQHSSATQLQRFEALMALTNLASASPEISSRIAEFKGLLNKVELLMLDDHPLVQRASVELICNLIAGSDTVFERYGGSEISKAGSSKIHVILALSDAEDLQTRLAASGALATLTSSPSACAALLSLQHERHRVLPILTRLIDPSVVPEDETKDEQVDEGHPGLVHRGIVCTCNFLLGIKDKAVQQNIRVEARNAGLDRALGNAMKNSESQQILQPATEALKFLLNTS